LTALVKRSLYGVFCTPFTAWILDLGSDIYADAIRLPAGFSIASLATDTNIREIMKGKRFWKNYGGEGKTSSPFI
jgi:hypothetical protein